MTGGAGNGAPGGACRRLAALAGHIYGKEAQPLWVQLMDAGAAPKIANRPKGCRCTAEKWRYVCRCFPCLEHAGRVGDFEWTTELLQARPAVPLQWKLKSETVSGSPEDPADKELGADQISGVTHYVSPDGRVVGPLTPSVHPRFSGIATFARLPQLRELVAVKEAAGALLRLRLLSAHRAGASRGQEETFILARIGTVVQRTRPVSGDRAWVFASGGPDLTFKVTPEDGVLELELFVSATGHSMGRCRIGLWSLPESRWARRELPLEDGLGQGIVFEAFLERNKANLADIAVLGVPFDSGCSFRPGARFGPEAIRANSRLIRPFLIGTGQRPLLERQVADAGDVPTTPFGIEQATAQIVQACKEQLQIARRLVLVGGDHTLSYPAIKAVADKFGPVVLIHFDSHLDTFPPMYNQDVWHGSPFRKCWEEGLLAKDGSTHIGIRATTYSKKDFADSDVMGIATLTAEDVHGRGVPDCVRVVRERYELSNHAPVYLSIDIDVLDPSVAPGTGTPEFGGLLAHQLLQFVRGMKGLPIVAADLVEVAPAYDHAGITAMAGAHLIHEEIALISSCMDVDGFG